MRFSLERRAVYNMSNRDQFGALNATTGTWHSSTKQISPTHFLVFEGCSHGHYPHKKLTQGELDGNARWKKKASKRTETVKGNRCIINCTNV